MKQDSTAPCPAPATASATAAAATRAADAARHDLWRSAPTDAHTAIPASLLPRGHRHRGGLRWHRDGDCWRARVEIGTLERGDLCVPSLVPGDIDVRGYAMWFAWPDDGRLALAPICSDAALADHWPAATMSDARSHHGALRGGLDCVECIEAVTGLTLEIEAVTSGPERSDPGEPPDADLLIGIRPRHARWRDRGGEAPELPVSALSQLECSADIARHVCSPISVAMVLDRLGLAVDPEPFARTAQHPQHAMLFGMWPLNLARARQAGAAGLVRVFTDADEAAELLRAGHALVVSIRFEAGALPGAPLPRTGGHLVVLRGMGPDRVLVNDPAADAAGSVSRHYDRAAFLTAWLADRGVGYVLWRRAAARS